MTARLHSPRRAPSPSAPRRRAGAVAACAWAVAACASVVAACAILVSTPASAAAPKQRTFATPEEAGAALIAAAESFDVAALLEIFGPEGVDLVVTQDPVLDRNQSAAFAAAAREKTAVVRDPKNRRRANLIVGKDDWPMPVPIVEKRGRWSFDAAAGREELLYRRIGRNELDAIEVCRGYVEAQFEYALEKRDGLNRYAQRIISTPGTQDGLAWQAPDGTWRGPVGEGIARVIAEGYTDRYEPFHGYYFKVLKGQGPAAPLGAMDYVIGGAMIGGFALVAAPAEYGVTGVKTFMVSHDGIVYEKDLGPDTVERFRELELYDPDKSWTPVVDQ
jgi:hypothetical protein